MNFILNSTLYLTMRKSDSLGLLSKYLLTMELYFDAIFHSNLVTKILMWAISNFIWATFGPEAAGSPLLL